jgi:hypothetical protein
MCMDSQTPIKNSYVKSHLLSLLEPFPVVSLELSLRSIVIRSSGGGDDEMVLGCFLSIDNLISECHLNSEMYDKVPCTA